MNINRRTWILFSSGVLAGAALVGLTRRPANPRQVAATEATIADSQAAGSRGHGATSESPATSTTRSGGLAATGSATPARQILERLKALKFVPNQPQSVRQLIVELEKLKQAGPAALPAIREFLAGGADADYDAGKGLRSGKIPTEFTMPPSLRLGLLETVKDIGGPAAEEILLHELKTTGRGVEVAYLAGVLQGIAADKYRDVALQAVRDLLAMPLSTAAPNSLDRSDRDYLFGVLTTAKDASYATQARAQVLLPDGRLDRAAMQYLQQSLGEESVALAARLWEDGRVAPNQKEPLARLALAYVGKNSQAEQLYLTAIKEPALTDGQRTNLIEDLNDTGYTNLKKPTPADIALMQKRLALIDQLAPAAKDPISIAAFAEARKDLIKMRDDALNSPAKPPRK